MRSALEFAMHLSTPWLMFAIAVCLGCGRTPDPSSEAANQTTVDGRTASEYLQSVFTRYRNAPSYRDEGIVRLTYQAGQRLEREQAPLRVWMESGRLYLEAYDLRVWADDQAMTAWIVDPSTNNFDSQVLRLPPVTGRPSLHSLLSDAVLSEKLSAGLAGPPPQLDWLLSEQPMERLFAEDHRITFAGERDLNGQRCLTVLVNADGQQYRFWIDKGSSIIRRVDLPPIPVADDASQQAQLTLELQDATFDAAQELPAIADLPAEPRMVGRFVPLPPARPAEALGQTAHLFELQDRTGRIKVNNQGSDRDTTVIFFATDQEASLSNAVAFHQWSTTLLPAIRNNVRFVLVADKATANMLPKNFSIPVVIDADQQAKRAIAATNRDPGFELVIIDRVGRIAWLQNQTNGPDGFVPLGPILRDISNGVDVAGRYLQQSRAAEATYRNLLGAEMAQYQASRQ